MGKYFRGFSEIGRLVRMFRFLFGVVEIFSGVVTFFFDFSLVCVIR